MALNTLRTTLHTNHAYIGGTVLYYMCRDIRAHDNDALLFAQELALSQGAQLVVMYNIWNYEWEGATRRFYDWVLPSLQEVEEELRKHSIPLVVTMDEKKLFSNAYRVQLPNDVGAVVVDQLPLTFMKRWKERMLSQYPDIPLYEVDAHNCIPVWHTSQKQEFAAHTIRRKIHAMLPDFLEEYGKLAVHYENQELLKTLAPIDWNDITSKIRCNESVTGVGSFVPGEKEAQKILTDFLHKKLSNYDESRDAINSDGQSNLSPYISHGNISRRRIVQEVVKLTGVSIQDAFDARQNGSNGKMGSIAAFIEECVVRAEISENFCYYNPSYDSFDGFPAWAKETLIKASTDARVYTYTKKEFEEARTHDALWNASQMQMVKSGKMHGYLRMYWAKKILEWSKSPQDAMKIAVYLNDTYELDGRDPGGYVGCAWSIGGVHDRPWFGRPIFGAVRYMAESGVAKRGKVKVYIEKWGSEKETLF
jgi:deoxyribodipyrimidine photo-lyase